MNHNTHAKEFEAIVMEYFDTYFINRDLKATMALCSDDFSGFGTGLDEIAYNRDVFEALYQRDIESLTTSIHYNIQEKHLTLIDEDTAIFMCQLNINGIVNDHEFALNHLRESIILKRIDGIIKIVHLHISFPTVEHEEGEAYPLKEIEDITKKVEAKVKEKTWTLMKAYKELEIAVVTDKLTQLLNRNRFDELLLQEINRANRYGSSFALVLLDLDLFKKINDNYGHLFGDTVLIALSNLLKENTRETDFAGRWGGEEFVLLLPETAKDEAITFAETLRHAVENIEFENKVSITASFGVTTYRSKDTSESIFERCDQAMYKAKSSGRNKTIFL